MKKILVLLMSLSLTGCYIKKSKTVYTHQNLQAALLVSLGMTKNEVKSVMSSPVKTEFSLNKEVWHYCNTGNSGQPDEFVAIIFIDGKTAGKSNYFVTLEEVGGAWGDCSKFVKPALR